MIYELLLTRSDIVFGFNRSRLGSFKRSPFSDRSPPNPRFNINILRASRGIFEEANPFIIKSNEFYLKVSPWSDCGLFDASSAKLEFFPLRHIRRFVLDIKTHKLVEAGWQEWLNAHETTEFFKPMEQLQCLTVRLLDRDFGGGSWSLSVMRKEPRERETRLRIWFTGSSRFSQRGPDLPGQRLQHALRYLLRPSKNWSKSSRTRLTRPLRTLHR